MKNLLLAVFLIATLGFILSACDDFRWRGAGADGDSGIFGDGDVIDGDHSADGDMADGDRDIDTDLPDSESASDGDDESGDASERDELADGDCDSDYADEASESETDDRESESEQEVAAECAVGPCCDNGYWVESGSACLSGQDTLDCTDDRCDEGHICRHELLDDYCLIGGECIEDGGVNPENECQWCDAEQEDKTEWSSVEEEHECDDENPCTLTDLCRSGVCRGEAPLFCSDNGHCDTSSGVCVCDSESAVDCGQGLKVHMEFNKCAKKITGNIVQVDLGLSHNDKSCTDTDTDDNGYCEFPGNAGRMHMNLWSMPTWGESGVEEEFSLFDPADGEWRVWVRLVEDCSDYQGGMLNCLSHCDPVYMLTFKDSYGEQGVIFSDISDTLSAEGEYQVYALQRENGAWISRNRLESPCDSDLCNEHQNCDPASGLCLCKDGYTGNECSSCAAGYVGYPDCEKIDPCSPDPCIHGDCSVNASTAHCSCDSGFGGDFCDMCDENHTGYPDCSVCINSSSCGLGLPGYCCPGYHCSSTVYGVSGTCIQ